MARVKESTFLRPRASMIRDGNTHQIDGYLMSAEQAGTGMQSLDTCIVNFVREGLITPEDALAAANQPDVLRTRLTELPED